MVPTAKEFYEKTTLVNPVEMMIAFTKLHIMECKEEMIKKAYVKDPITGGTVYCSSRRLNKAYPLNKIK